MDDRSRIGDGNGGRVMEDVGCRLCAHLQRFLSDQDLTNIAHLVDSQ